jgi:transcription termination factor Rho
MNRPDYRDRNYRNHFNQNRPSHGYQGPDRRQQRRPEGPRQEVTEAERSFLSKVSIDPSPRIRLEAGLPEPTMRAMDMLCPIGKGQRGLIVAPPTCGKTTLLRHLCKAISTAEPSMKVYCLLIDERPEEVTDFKRNSKAEVHWSSIDLPYENHVRVANELMKKAYEEANAGQDVLILLDSLTRLARVHNSETRGQGRTLSGGVDARGLEIPRRIFGSARKIESGGSLAILATILVDTGSRMDEVIFQEFKGTGNMEIVLSRDISGRRIFPAVDIGFTGTRKEELLFDAEEYQGVRKLRSALGGKDKVQAAETLVKLMEKYPTNKELLAVFAKEK